MKKLFLILPIIAVSSFPILAEAHSYNDEQKTNKMEYSKNKGCKKYKKAKMMKYQREIKDIKNEIKTIKNDLKIS